MKTVKTWLLFLLIMLIIPCFIGSASGQDNLKRGEVIILAPDSSRSLHPSDFDTTVKIMEKRVKDIRSLFPGIEGYLVKTDLEQQQIVIWLSEISARREVLAFLMRIGKLNFRVDGSIIMEGGDLKKAEVALGLENRPVIEVEFGTEGTKQFEELSTINTGKKMGIYLDDELIMEVFLAEPIHDGRGIITMGDRSIEEAQKIACLMRTGFLPVGLRIVKGIYGVPYQDHQ